MPRESEERKVNEVAVGGGDVSVAVTRFPTEQKRPVGPLVVVGVRDGVLWLIDRYMCAHTISLSHPGIYCCCLAAHGHAVSAVKCIQSSSWNYVAVQTAPSLSQKELHS